MSPPGRPQGECRTAQPEGTPASVHGVPKDDTATAPPDGSPSGAPGEPSALIEPRALRSALGRFATGVTIVTCVDPSTGAPVGLTANSFGALSLDPPLVLWSLRLSSPSVPAFRAAAHFAVNVLAEAQVELSRRFASQVADKFAAGQWSPGLGGAPVLAGCAAVFECQAAQQQEAGDHVLFIGRVLRMADAGVAPLVFQGGHYRMLGEVL